MLEKAVFFSEYNNINITGNTSKYIILTVCTFNYQFLSYVP